MKTTMSNDRGPTIPRASFLASATRPEQYPPADRPEVAFAGRSNVGKSSLLNVLVERRQLARVSHEPGRTRMLNFFAAGDEVVLVDLPGYGYARVAQQVRASWQPMIETYLLQRENLATLVLLVDIRRDPGDEERLLIRLALQRDLWLILVATKADQVAPGKVGARVQSIADQLDLRTSWIVPFSRLTRMGRAEIWQRIGSACRRWRARREGEAG